MQTTATMTAPPPDLTAAASALNRQRLAALLEKYRRGTASRAEIDELYADAQIAALLPPRHVEKKPQPPAPPASAPKTTRPYIPPPPEPAAPDPRISQWIIGLLVQAFKPRPKGSLLPWVKDNIMLSSEESSGAPGPYNPELEAWTGILYDFVQDNRYDECIVLKPSRCGYTLACFIIICWWFVHYSTNAIFCIDNAKEVKKIVRKRIIPLVKSVKALGDVIPANDRQLTQETLYLKGRTLYCAGAASVSSVTNKSASLVVTDEQDQFRDFASGEANALEHLRDRVMDVPGSKLIVGGKPRNVEDILWPEYLTGTRHRMFVPCPHCTHLQTLDFKQLKFDHCRDDDGAFDLERVGKETFYECVNPECRLSEPHFGRMEEKDKPGMIAAREWRQTNFGQDEDKPEPRKMSVHTSQLYSLRPKITWSAIALHFIKAQKKGGRALAHFFRTRLGEPYREKQTIIKGEMVRALAKGSTYRHGECPVVPAVVLMAVDVQIDVKKWSKLAFLSDGTAFILDHGECLTYDDLYEIAENPITVLDWGDVSKDERTNPIASYIWIDEGDGDNSTKDVRDFCARPRSRKHPIHGGHWIFPCKGAGGHQIKGAVDERPREVDGYEFKGYHVSHNEFATELYLQRIAKHDDILAALEIMRKQPSKRLPLPAPRLHLMKSPDEEFIAELCAEKRQLKKVRGRLRWVWIDPTDPNDYGDTVKYCLAMWHFIRADFGWEPPDDDDDSPKQRDYILRERVRVLTSPENASDQLPPT